MSIVGSLDGVRIDNGHSPRTVMAKRKQQRKPVTWIGLQCTRLRIAQPALSNQIVEERVQTLCADVRRGLAWESDAIAGWFASK